MGLVPGWSETLETGENHRLDVEERNTIIVNIYIFMILNMSIKKKENYLEHCFYMYR